MAKKFSELRKRMSENAQEQARVRATKMLAGEYADIADLVPKRCAKCLQHYFNNAPHIIEAFASVGIEHGKSSGLMAREFYKMYHKNKHRDPVVSA